MTTRKPAPSRRKRGEAPQPTLPPREFWDEMIALFNTIPEEERARMPRDGARNFDHYLDGAPRQN